MLGERHGLVADRSVRLAIPYTADQVEWIHQAENARYASLKAAQTPQASEQMASGSSLMCWGD